MCEAKPRSFEEKKASRPRVGRVLKADVESTNQKRKNRHSLHYDFGFLAIGRLHSTAKGRATRGAQNPRIGVGARPLPQAGQ